MSNLFGDGEVIDDEEVSEASTPNSHADLTYALEIIGYDDIETQIVQLLNNDRLPHALIFAGDKGRGKYSFALRLSRALLSAQKQSPYDNLSIERTDPIISRIERESHPDLKTIRRLNKDKKNELASEIVIKSVRDANHFFTLKSVETGHRIVIVDEADTLNIEAQNAFLKTLEEPPNGALLILIANRPAQLLPTIRSRAQVITFNALPKETLMAQNPELKNLEPAIQNLILGLSRGGIGAMTQLLEDDVVEAVTKIHTLMASKDMNEVQGFSESWGTATPGNLDSMQLLEDIVHHTLYTKLLQDAQNTKLLTAIDGIKELFEVARTRYLDKRQIVREAFTIYAGAV